MKTSINFEFTNDELEKLAVNVARRAGLNFIHDAIKHFGALKIPPGFMDTVGQVLSSAFASKAAGVAGAAPVEPDAEFEPRTKCERIENNPNLDDGWICCKCNGYNGAYRAACRNCMHGRCDVVVSPPPPADPSAH